MPSQKELEKAAARVAEKTTHAATSKKVLAVLAAVLAIAAGVGFRHPEVVKGRVLSVYAAVVGKELDIPSLPDGFPSFNLFQGDDGQDKPIGLRLREAGLRPKHPVIIVPGFVTSGLELWRGDECARKFFRARLWAGGNFGMARTLLADVDCWLQHMALDAETGLDTPGIHLRPAVGFEAVDYFVPGYAVWAKAVEALADLGYDSNNLMALTYDWRLAIPNLEIRDSYFSRMKNAIEECLRIHREKVAVASHSWGDNVFRSFLQWTEAVEEGWTERHIATYINIAGPALGVPKSIPAFLSGESRDTADLGLISQFLGEKLVPARRRAALFRTWGAGIGMLPVGGDAVWGNLSWAPDDTAEMRAANHTYGQFMSVAEVSEEMAERARAWHRGLPQMLGKWLSFNETAKHDESVEQNTIEGAISILLEAAGARFAQQTKAWSAAVPTKPECKPIDGKDAFNYHYSPLYCPLPKAPSMSMYCLYGTGKSTERSYQYLHLRGPKAREEQQKQRKAEDSRSSWYINGDLSDDEWTNGVRMGDGDGTVPLISLGLMCRTAWREKRLNPSGIRVRQREYAHQPVHPLRDIRGGPRSADHVDILGNIDVMEDLLRIVAGQQLDDNVTSSLDKIAAGIELPGDASKPPWSWLA